MYFKRD